MGHSNLKQNVKSAQKLKKKKKKEIAWNSGLIKINWIINEKLLLDNKIQKKMGKFCFA